MKNKLILSIILSLVLVGCSNEGETLENSTTIDSEVSNSTVEKIENSPTIDIEDSNLSDEELFNQAMSEALDPTTAHLKMYQQTEMITAETTTVNTAEHEIKYDMIDDDNIKYYMKSSSESPQLAEVGDIEIYYLDGYFYTTYGETKMKSKVSSEDLFTMVDYSGAGFNREDLMHFSVADEDHQYVFAYAIKEEALPEYKEEIEQIHGVSEGVEFITASGQTVISKEGEIIESDIRIEIDINTPALSGKFITHTYTQYYTIGEAVTITLPEDVDSYIEY